MSQVLTAEFATNDNVYSLDLYGSIQYLTFILGEERILYSSGDGYWSEWVSALEVSDSDIDQW